MIINPKPVSWLVDIMVYNLLVWPRGRLTPLICDNGARSPLPGPRQPCFIHVKLMMLSMMKMRMMMTSVTTEIKDYNLGILLRL